MRNMPTAKKICIKSIVTSPPVRRKGALSPVRVRLPLPAAPGLPGQVYRYGFLTAERIISIQESSFNLLRRSSLISTGLWRGLLDDSRGFQSPTEKFTHFDGSWYLALW